MKKKFLCAALSLWFMATGGAAESRTRSRDARTTSPWADFVETNFPFYSSVLDARKPGEDFAADNLTPRGIILNLGHDCWACFDTDLLRISAIWTGPGLTPVSMSQGSYHTAGLKAQEGQDKLPQMAGTPWLVNGIYPGWQTGERIVFADPREPGPDSKEVGRGPLPASLGRFKAVRLVGDGVRLEYEVAGASISETIEARRISGAPVVQRRFRLENVKQPLWLALGKPRNDNSLNLLLSVAQSQDKPIVYRADQPNGLLALRVRAWAEPVEFTVAMGSGNVQAWRDPANGPPLARWPEQVTTQGTLSTAKDAYVVDEVALPNGNPWRRNVRIADVTFFDDGRAAAVTFDGDVWMISGLSGDLRAVTWRRFTSGLHEPLSIAVRGGELFVFDRNGIWRLRDTDGNDEADVHELFCNLFTQTAETREFAAAMRTAPDGTFVIAKGGQQSTTVGKHNGSVLRIAADGKSATVIAHGLRQPFIGVNRKTGMVTASDQQGHYIPTTPLHIIDEDRYYGFIPTFLPKEKYPAAIAEPLTWIPHPINASGAGQVWLTDAKMGPLNDALIHVGYYRPEVFTVLLNRRAKQTQAAVVSLTRDLTFAPLTAVVNPTDGQLYVAGFQIWGSTAKEISGIARLRYTGAPYALPREVAALDKGILLRFDVPLDASVATNPANFSVERWNYRRTANYGSPHFKPDGSKGQESMTPSSAYLSRDGKAVFIGVPGMQRVMQMRLGWALAAKDGTKLSQNAYFTPHELTPFDPSAEGFDRINVDLTPRTAVLAAVNTPITVEEGQRISELMGCVACHSTDGSTLGKVGPTWKSLFNSERRLADGGKTKANEAYLRESIREPALRVVSGFEKSDTGMPSYEGVISDAQIEALVLYIKSLR
jgi:mono/diheme cytochrome c family protein